MGYDVVLNITLGLLRTNSIWPIGLGSALFKGISRERERERERDREREREEELSLAWIYT